MQVYHSTNSVTTASTDEELETFIDQGTEIVKQTFSEMGMALAELRDREVYKKRGYTTFATYVEQRFHFTRQQADHLISGAATLAALNVALPVETPRPETERQLRPLRQLAREAPQVAAEVWQETVKQHGPQPTASQVREAVIQRTAPVREWSPEQPADVREWDFERAHVTTNTRIRAMRDAMHDELNKPEPWALAAQFRKTPINAQSEYEGWEVLRNRIEEYMDALLPAGAPS